MMEAVRTFETSVDNHFTRQYNPEDSSEQNILGLPTVSIGQKAKKKTFQGPSLSQSSVWLLMDLYYTLLFILRARLVTSYASYSRCHSQSEMSYEHKSQSQRSYGWLVASLF
jgi:hypothetical protein